jgi:hypothetical protein
MRKSVNVIKQLLEECSDQDRDEWKSHAQTILGAIRGSHPTKRGVNGAIAAAFFENCALPAIEQHGWARATATQTNDPSSPVIEKNGRAVHVLIAILQFEAGKPRRQLSSAGREDQYVVQVQKKLSRVPVLHIEPRDNGPRASVFPRAYSFGDFDVLAVNMQPVTRRWTDFRYTLAAWLAPFEKDTSLIAPAQSVSLESSGIWTDRLPACLDWLVDESRQRAI